MSLGLEVVSSYTINSIIVEKLDKKIGEFDTYLFDNKCQYDPEKTLLLVQNNKVVHQIVISAEVGPEGSCSLYLSME